MDYKLLIEMLNVNDIVEIKKYLELCQKNYCISNEQFIYIDFMYGIKEYDKLVKILDIDEPRDMIENEMIDREKFLDIITIFKTNIDSLYFVRMEQYGYADEDAVVYRLAFANDISLLMDKCKEYARRNDLIKNRKKQKECD